MQQMASHNTMYYSLTAAKPSAAGGINTGALARVGGNGSSTDTSPTKSNIIHMGKSNLAPGVLGAGSQHHHHHSPVHINNAAAAGQDMYASLAEQTDMRNEILMELQRQKMWSYAENGKHALSSRGFVSLYNYNYAWCVSSPCASIRILNPL